MGEGMDRDRFGHAILVLRAVRAGVVTLDAEARNYTFEDVTSPLGLYTDDGSCLTTEAARRIREAVERAGDGPGNG